MDFCICLDKFRVGDAPLQRFPWLGFDHGTEPHDFHNYPTVYSWDQDLITRLRASSQLPEPKRTDSSSILAFLQAWLFVGAVESALGLRLTTSEFVRQTPKGMFVSLAFLRPAVASWSLNVGQLPIETQKQKRRHLQTILAEIQHWSYTLNCWAPRFDWKSETKVKKPDPIKSYEDFDYNLERLSCLITLVGEILNTVKSYLASDLDGEGALTGFRGAYTDTASARLVWRLTQAGWCQYMARVLTEHRFSVAEFATFWPSAMPKFETERHRRCSYSRCIGYDVDTANYQTRHVCKDRECGIVNTPSLLEGVRYVLEAGGIPVIDLDLDEDGEGQRIAQLKVVNALSQTTIIRYAAFSHVWSDGLGSCTEDGLPYCQIQQLFKAAAGCGYGWVWVDSLCVPKQENLRQLAIQRMAQTYSQSAVTIIHDRTLMSLRFSEPGGRNDRTDIELVLLKLIVSPWMQRLWTLQEALLSPNLVFRFANCMVTGENLSRYALQAVRSQINPVNQTLAREASRVLHHSWSGNLESPKLGDIGRMLRLRATSKARDETLAIAGILGVDARRLLEEKPEHRMKCLLKLLKFVPSSIIFLDGARMPEIGWRWAVKSMLRQERPDNAALSAAGLTTGKFASGVQAECLDNGGLLASFTVLKLGRRASLNDTASSQADSVWAVTPETTWKIIPGDSFVFGDFEFDAILTNPHLQDLRDIWLGVAVLSTDDNNLGHADGEVTVYAYARRVILRDMSKSNTSSAKANPSIPAQIQLNTKVLLT